MPGMHVASFGTALLASIVVSVVSFVAHAAVRPR
jgi:uncharacterized membrane protein YvlD (DUF360 family)